MHMNVSAKEFLGLRDGRDEYPLALKSAAPRTDDSRDVFGSEQKLGGGIPFSLGRDNLRKSSGKIFIY
ncbi:hypothetical protein CY34DRAFT_807711 [Suillus luteus UH-Slu-Lm8-n1]|uniref:Unplaced genomic scaffold CY34scaffold_191, whole genome shotgun sequence n=1 Tax=Suillus luteus UH-Slu-Lm8-n1 TaxID=930992 RepID=A0A0D0B842_9AGAM|nr:hypothetical protein CY34DRAFT_807711 [Suillus luteus UH-Slu-Lm8-n1]